MPGTQAARSRKAVTGQPSLTVAGFKSVRDPLTLQLQPLTVLCGTNSSGKSAFLQPLLLLKQTLEAPYDPGPLLLDGPHVSFDNAHEMLWRGRSRHDTRDTFTVGYNDGEGSETHIDFALVASRLDVKELRHRSPARGNVKARTLRMTRDMKPSAIRKILEPLYRPLFDAAKGGADIQVKRDRSFLGVGFSISEGAVMDVPYTFHDPLRTLAIELIHLPGLRDVPTRQYPRTQHGTLFPGPFPLYTASVIEHWVDSGDERLATLGTQLKQLGLTWKVHARRTTDTRITVQVGRLPRAQHGGAHDLVNLADVGLGVSQTLPVLVALLVAREGQTVYLEQPEIHLHPRAQSVMGKILVDASERGVRLICETHSHLLLQSIQTAVARNAAAAPGVSLNWFSRDKDGATSVATAILDESGTFGDWPIDFADVELQSETDLLAASLQSWD